MTKGLRIMIVEDDDLVAMDLADLLIAMGHEVCTIVHSENEAVEVIVRHEPDLIVIDISLTKGDGVSMMRNIPANGFVPHIYVAENPLHIKELEVNAVVVTKPFKINVLTDGIAKALTIGE